MPTTIWSEDFESISNTSTADIAYSSNGSVSYLPSGWEKFSDTSSGTYAMTIGHPWREAGTNGYWQMGPGLQSNTWGGGKNFLLNRSRGWIIATGGTGSSSTGPYGGNINTVVDGGFDANNSSFTKYLCMEATSQGASGYADATNRYRGIHLIRTDAIDLTSYGSTDDIRFEGYFHMYGAAQGALGFACTTDDTKAGEQKFTGGIGWVNNAAFTGSGFTGYTNDDGSGTDGGGLTISYDSNGDGTIDVTSASGKKRIVGQQQTSGHSTAATAPTATAANKWRKFSADMTGAGGQTVYIYMMVESHNFYSYKWNMNNSTHGNNYFKADTCLDTLSVKYYPPTTDDSDHYEGKIFSIAGSSIQKICNEDLDEDDKVYSTDGTAAPGNHRVRLLLNGTDNTWTGDAKKAIIMHYNANTSALQDDTEFDFGNGDYQTLSFPTGYNFINMLIRFEHVPDGNSTWSVSSSTVTENAYNATTNPQGLTQVTDFSWSSGGSFWQALFRIGNSASFQADSTVTIVWTD